MLGPSKIIGPYVKLTAGADRQFERRIALYESTAMAWVRTATSFITFGFAIYKFFEIETHGIDIGPRVVGT